MMPVQQRNTAWLIWAALLAMGVLLSACSDDTSDLRRWMDEQQQQAPAPLASMPTVPAYRALAYAGEAGSDPFDAGRLDASAREGSDLTGVDPRASLPPLERQPLEAMAMVGVVDRGLERLALMRVDGALFAVREGQRVGVHGGTIQMISERSVTVSEPVRDALGRTTRRTSVLTLKEAKP